MVSETNDDISAQKPIQFIKERIDAINIKFLFDIACITSGLIDAIVNCVEAIEVLHHRTDDNKDELTSNVIVKSEITKIELIHLTLNAVQGTLQRMKNSYKDINDDNLDKYLDE